MMFRGTSVCYRVGIAEMIKRSEIGSLIIGVGQRQIVADANPARHAYRANLHLGAGEPQP